MIMKGENTE